MPRDPKRIPKYIERLRAIWETFPDWRLSQLFVNILRYLPRDPFYMEDEEFMQMLEDIAARWQTNKET